MPADVYCGPIYVGASTDAADLYEPYTSAGPDDWSYYRPGD